MSILPPIDLTQDGNVVPLGITPKERPEDSGLMLNEVPFDACQHFSASFTLDMKAGKCLCRECGGEVAPMFVLEQLMKHESRWMRTRATYQDEMRRLEERARTKCQHCGEMTRISK